MLNTYGSYKISYPLAKRMIGYVSDRKSDEGVHAGASKYEILALIHFSHISDNAGFIEGFKTVELVQKIGCSRREAFHVIRSLEKKGFIYCTSSEWRGCRDIRMIDNDFSVYTKDKLYINTNRAAFFPCTKGADTDRYAGFRSLSLYAMRLYLFFLMQYREKYGYHASYEAICDALGLHNRFLINKYLEEINHNIANDDEMFHVFHDPKKRRMYGFIEIRRGHAAMQTERGTDGKDTYFKRHIIQKIRGAGLYINTLALSQEEYGGRLYACADYYLKANLSIEHIERVILDEITKFGMLCEPVIERIHLHLLNDAKPPAHPQPLPA